VRGRDEYLKTLPTLPILLSFFILHTTLKHQYCIKVVILLQHIYTLSSLSYLLCLMASKHPESKSPMAHMKSLLLKQGSNTHLLHELLRCLVQRCSPTCWDVEIFSNVVLFDIVLFASGMWTAILSPMHPYILVPIVPSSKVTVSGCRSTSERFSPATIQP